MDLLLLETDRLALRRFTPADAPLLLDLDSDSEVMRYISRGRPTSMARITGEILPRWLAWYERDPALGYFAAHERTSGAFLGWFQFRPSRLDPEEMEVGYRLRRAVWGVGYATEGTRALIDKAFNEGLCERVVAFALPGNAASVRVMEKCGLRFEERLVYPERYLPGWTEAERLTVKYGLCREEWGRKREAPEAV